MLLSGSKFAVFLDKVFDILHLFIHGSDGAGAVI